MIFRASKCPCGAKVCKDWHVDPVAALQGVSFTEKQARAVALLLNMMENARHSDTTLIVTPKEHHWV